MTPTSTKTTPPAPTKPTRRILGLVLATIVVAAIALGLVYFFGGAEPPEVDLDATVNAVAQSTILESTTQSTSPDSAPDTTLAGASGLIPPDVTGRWIVDTDTGTFSIEEATASYAGFRVEEELAQIGASTAVGRSPVVSGAVTIDQTTITQAEIEVDLTAIVTDESRRDRAIREALNTAQYPTATFVLTEPIDFGQVPSEGATVAATATGDMTINGVTRTIEIPLEAQVQGESILIVGSTDVVFADFQVDTPSAPMVLSVADQGIIELQLWLERA